LENTLEPAGFSHAEFQLILLFIFVFKKIIYFLR